MNNAASLNVEVRSTTDNENVSRFKKDLSGFIRQCISLFQSYDFYRNFKKNVLNKMINILEYDVIYTTYGPTACNLCGLLLKRKYSNIKWIADFRDPMVVEDTPWLFKKIFGYIQNNTCKKADHIISVSEGYNQRICGKSYQYKSSVITNGYDEEDYVFDGAEKDSNKFSFAYAGALYEGKRDAKILFKLLRELIDSKQVDKTDLKFNYAGNDFVFLMKQAQNYGLEHILINHGFIPRNECLKMLKESRYLVLLTWNSVGEEGVLPGKSFEYILMKIPIIAIINGNRANSEVYQIIQKTKAGIAYESVQDDAHYSMLKNYIHNEYNQYRKGVQSDYLPDKDTIEKYNYSSIADEVITIINDLV